MSIDQIRHLQIVPVSGLKFSYDMPPKRVFFVYEL
jgi:hypothetical protein